MQIRTFAFFITISFCSLHFQLGNFLLGACCCFSKRKTIDYKCKFFWFVLHFHSWLLYSFEEENCIILHRLCNKNEDIWKWSHLLEETPEPQEKFCHHCDKTCHITRAIHDQYSISGSVNWYLSYQLSVNEKRSRSFFRWKRILRPKNRRQCTRAFACYSFNHLLRTVAAQPSKKHNSEAT